MRRYSIEERGEILREIAEVGKVGVVCRKYGISPTTAHNWLKKDKLSKGGRDCLVQNRRLKKEVSELKLKNSILKDLLKKTHQVF